MQIEITYQNGEQLLKLPKEWMLSKEIIIICTVSIIFYDDTDKGIMMHKRLFMY